MGDPQTLIALLGTLGVVLAGLVYLLLQYRASAMKWRDRADTWFHRAVMLGWDDYQNYPITEAQAEKIMRDLFPRPMGAVPSVEVDVVSLKAWREQRALSSRDHTTRHFAEGAVPSEWATEVLMLTIGGGECDV